MSSKSIIITIAIAAAAGACAALAVSTYSSGSDIVKVDPTLATRISKLEAQLLVEQGKQAKLVSLIAERTSQGRTNQENEQALGQEVLDELIDTEQIAVDDAQLSFEVPEVSPRNTRRQNRKRALIAGGFDETEANLVLDTESQIQLDELFEQHQLRRAAIAKQSEEANPWFDRKTRQDRLRDKLGEEYFEKYLKANGWPTSASVQNVLIGSPAEQAGLQAGDKITSYAGERVFNLRDVNRLTLDGSEGESVLIEVERDGNQIQVTLPRGPIGVSGG